MKKIRWIKGLCVGALATASVGMLSACDLLSSLGIGGSSAPEGFNGFVDGMTQTQVTLGDSWDMAEIVDYVQWDEEKAAWVTELHDSTAKYAEHTLELSKGEEVIKMTGRNSYDFDAMVEPGAWTLTYDITEKCDYQGKWTLDVQVTAPEIGIEMTLNESNWTYYYGTTVAYEDLFEDINLAVSSYYQYEATLTDVTIGEQTKSLADTSSYTFTDLGEHVFTLTITNAGGQTFTQAITLNVIYRDIYSAALYLPEGVTGTQLIPITEEISNVQINGNAVAEADMQKTAEGLAVSNALIRQYPGDCVVSFTLANGEIASARFTVFTGDVDFEDGTNSVLVSYGTYAQDGKNGSVVLEDNVGWEGNTAVYGKVSGGSTNLMNFNFNPYFLTAIFEGGAECFTFDLICDLPYLRFVREGGGYLIDADEQKYETGNSYLVADADDVGFAEYTEKLQYNGKTLYRFSLTYYKAQWLKISNNGAASPAEYFSTVVFDWSSEVNKVSAKDEKGKEKYAQVTQNVALAYIDNIKICSGTSDDITFADGNKSGNLITSWAGTTCGAADVVKFGDDYALKLVTRLVCNRNTTAFGLQTSYLHQVFNVAGATALQFTVYRETATMAEDIKLYLSGFNGSTRKDSAALPSTFDAETHTYTFTITADLYHTYFDANGEYIADSFSGVNKLDALKLGMSSTTWKAAANGVEGRYSSGSGTEIYFDDFVKVMP